MRLSGKKKSTTDFAISSLYWTLIAKHMRDAKKGRPFKNLASKAALLRATSKANQH